MALQTALATFTGVGTTAAVTWTTMPGNYAVLASNPVITAGPSGVLVWLSSVTSSGATVNVNVTFTGTITVTVFDRV